MFVGCVVQRRWSDHFWQPGSGTWG